MKLAFGTWNMACQFAGRVSRNVLIMQCMQHDVSESFFGPAHPHLSRAIALALKQFDCSVFVARLSRVTTRRTREGEFNSWWGGDCVPHPLASEVRPFGSVVHRRQPDTLPGKSVVRAGCEAVQL